MTTPQPPPDNVVALHSVPIPVSPSIALPPVVPPPAIPLGPTAGSTSLVGADRRRLQQARDSLIDCEDALLYVVVHDASLQPLIDQIVEVLMDVSRRADAAISAPTPTQEG